MAKQIIADAGLVSVPETVLRDPTNGYRLALISPPQRQTLTNIQTETPWMGFVPDLMSTELAIEITVTHPSDPAKIAAYSAHTITALEISLPRHSPTDLPSLTQAVLHSAPRRWLNNPTQQAAEAQLAQQAAQAEAAAQAKAKADAIAAAAQAALAEAAKSQAQRNRDAEYDLDLANSHLNRLANQRHRAAQARLNNLRNEIAQREPELSRDMRPAAPNNRTCFLCGSPSAFFGAAPKLNGAFQWHNSTWACLNHKNQLPD